MIGIYKVTSQSGKIYIGQSINIEKRFKSYRNLLHCKKQIKLYNSFLKYGVNNHNFEILEECKAELLNQRERYYQEFYNVLKFGLNCMLTNTNDKSGKMSIDSRLKMSIKLIGNKRTLGLKRSQEQKDLISNRMKGNTPWNIGVKRTENELIKMSLNRKGKMVGENNHCSNLIINLETGIFYFGIKEASDSFDGKYHSMRDRLNGKTKNKTSFKCLI
jgi:group I intron endonuclease